MAVWIASAGKRGLNRVSAARAEGLFHSGYRLPAECRKQPNGWLLDELVFGISVSHINSNLFKTIANHLRDSFASHS